MNNIEFNTLFVDLEGKGGPVELYHPLPGHLAFLGGVEDPRRLIYVDKDYVTALKDNAIFLTDVVKDGSLKIDKVVVGDPNRPDDVLILDVNIIFKDLPYENARGGRSYIGCFQDIDVFITIDEETWDFNLQTQWSVHPSQYSLLYISLIGQWAITENSDEGYLFLMEPSVNTTPSTEK